MTLKTSFASILRSVRSKRNISQREFGSTASRTYLSKLESARCSITLDKLEQISQRLELSPLTLLTLTLIEDSGRSVTDLINQVEAEIQALSDTEERPEPQSLQSAVARPLLHSSIAL